MCDHQTRWYIHDLFDVLNNPMKFQLKWIRTQNFQLNLFDTPVILKYGQGLWKWYEKVKLHE